MIFSSDVNTVRGKEDILNIFNNPVGPYWFLYALLSIFIIVPIIEKLCKNNKKYVFAIFVIIKLMSLVIKTNIYFIDSIMGYAIYFYFGSFINDKNALVGTKNKLYNVFLVIVYTIFALIFYKFKEQIGLRNEELISILFALSGIYICINIFRNVKKIKILDSFDKYTFQIYLLHTIFAAGVRIVLLKLGVTNYCIQFVAGLLASIYIPVLVSIICEKVKILNIFFYPVNTVKELKSSRKE